MLDLDKVIWIERVKEADMLQRNARLHLEEKVPDVSLTDPELELRQGEVGVGRTGPQQPPVQGMTVDKQLDLRATYAQGDPMPGAVGQSKGERLDVYGSVAARYVVKSKLVLATAALQLQVPDARYMSLIKIYKLESIT